MPVAFENIESGAKGYFHIEDNRIAIIDSIDWKVKTIMAERNEEQAKDGFVEFDPAIFEGSPFAEDVPFVKAEVDQPAGFVKIQPPLDMTELASDKKIEIHHLHNLRLCKQYFVPAEG